MCSACYAVLWKKAREGWGGVCLRDDAEADKAASLPWADKLCALVTHITHVKMGYVCKILKRKRNHPSIDPSIHLLPLRVLVTGGAVYTDTKTSFSPAISFIFFRGNTKPVEKCNPNVPILPWGFLLVGHAQNTSARRCPGGIQVRCCNYFNWLLLMRRSNSTLKPHWRTKLLTLSLRGSQDICWIFF